MFIDTHCHLDATEFGGTQDALVKEARAAGVSHIVLPSVAAANFTAVQNLCAKYSACAPAYGIHPMYSDRARPDDLDMLRDYLQQQPVAVGEIGLDFFVQDFNREKQEYYFLAQLKLAQEYGLPLDSIVLETDAPDIPPEFLQRGEPNRPSYLPRIAETLAQLRNLPLEEIARITSANALAALPGLQQYDHGNS